MIAWLGDIGTLVAFAASLTIIWRGFRGVFRPDLGHPRALKGPAIALAVGALTSMGALELGLLTNDFSIRYIANNSAIATPLYFKVAAAWAALEGSIVLWGFVLTGFLVSVWLRYRKRDEGDPLWSGALGVLGVIGAFFFGLMLTLTNPFSVCTQAGAVGCAASSTFPWAAVDVPVDGFGPNALLQNHWLMALHPPFLYLGYVGMMVPYAFGMGALILGRGGPAWLEQSRSWTLVSWMFLTFGIVLGGLWSYEVLGWGGYWAWDPVENASFMPWLAATAFLHSSVIQRRRGMLQSWNFILVIASFSLTILGTFLTRSGVVQSVHSFTQSPIGPALLWFLMFVLVVSLALFTTRAHLVASSPRLESLASREGVFLFNNLLLVVFAFVVLIGTLYPLFALAFSGVQIGVGRPFYDRLAIPISFLLLAAMGVGPITPYRVAKGEVVWQRIRTPLLVALAASAGGVFLGLRGPLVNLSVLLSVFVMGVIVRNWVETARPVAAKTGIGLGVALTKVARRDPHYWGGQLSHLGVAILAMGIAVSSHLSIDREIQLALGETTRVAGFELQFETPFLEREPSRTVTGAVVNVFKDGELINTLRPRLNDYVNQNQVVTAPAVDTMPSGDLYLTLTQINQDRLAMEVHWFPFIWLVWLGGFLAAAAGLFAYLVPKQKRTVPVVPDEVTAS